MKRSTHLTISLALLLALTATACGQKPGVALLPAPRDSLQGLVLPQGATVDPETGAIVDAQGNVIGNVGDIGAGDLDSVSAAANGTAAGSAQGGTDATAATGTTGGGAPASDERLGGGTIKLGAHAPLTGAAPIPSDSAEKGNDLYYKWLKDQERAINGRYIESILKNDNYNPSQAVAVCKEMVEKDGVFLLYGFAGTDQIQACARYAASAGVPYLSTGTTESGIKDLPGYFALSLTYPQQGELLADMLTSDLGAKGERNGMLRFDTPNFEDAHTAFVEAMNKRGIKLAYDRAVSKQAGQTEAQTVVQEMSAAGIENVYVLTSPVWFLQVLQAARTQDYQPQWVGVGITKALDTVASVGCRNGTLNRAKFFSPFPAWADIDRFDPEFKKAIRAVYPNKGEGDDIMLIGWGLGKVIAELLDETGRDLSRARFVANTQRVRNVKTGVYPEVSFSPNDHLGGTQVHLNEAQCSGYKNGDNRWHTIKPFVSDF